MQTGKTVFGLYFYLIIGNSLNQIGNMFSIGIQNFSVEIQCCSLFI